jgi:ribonuclease HI
MLATLPSYESYEDEDGMIIYGDSQLVIKQMNRTWKIKKEDAPYTPLALKALELTSQFSHLDRLWIPREENSLADSLAAKVLFSNGTICTPCIANDQPKKLCDCYCHASGIET